MKIEPIIEILNDLVALKYAQDSQHFLNKGKAIKKVIALDAYNLISDRAEKFIEDLKNG